MASDIEPEDEGRRSLQDTANRAVVIALLRAGLGTAQVAQHVGVHIQTLRREWRHDPDFKRQCDEAINNRYEPVVEHAITLALKADVAGENEGAHRALKEVMQVYDKHLARQAKFFLTPGESDRNYPGGGQVSLVMGPESTKVVLDRLGLAAEEKRAVIETTGELTEEDDDDE